MLDKCEECHNPWDERNHGCYLTIPAEKKSAEKKSEFYFCSVDCLRVFANFYHKRKNDKER